MKQGRVTIHDVAAAAGVSVSTVSKAMNGRYGVSSAAAERVRAAVKELGYETSLVASGMRAARTGVVGVLVADVEPFSAEVLKGVSAGLHDSPYDLLAYSRPRERGSDGWERASLSRLSGSLIDGAIIVTPTIVDLAADIPIVAIDPHAGPAALPTVESDSFGGAREVVRYLIGLGHTRIGFVAGRRDLRSSAAREAGYRKALMSAGLTFDPSLVVTGDYEAAKVREVAATLLTRPNRPTAIFAANDVSALAVMESAAEMGLDVPTDLSVVGFDDIPEASRSDTGLTTVRQPLRRLGAEAARMLIALMDGRTLSDTHLRFPTRLVYRDSARAPIPPANEPG